MMVARKWLAAISVTSVLFAAATTVRADLTSASDVAAKDAVEMSAKDGGALEMSAKDAGVFEMSAKDGGVFEMSAKDGGAFELADKKDGGMVWLGAREGGGGGGGGWLK